MSCKYCISGEQHPWGVHANGCTCYGCSNTPVSNSLGYGGGHKVTCYCSLCVPDDAPQEVIGIDLLRSQKSRVPKIYFDDPTFDAVVGRDSDDPEINLSVLTPKQRFVIECSYGLGRGELTEREIAHLMGISHQAVHKLKEKALTKLRKNVGSE